LIYSYVILTNVRRERTRDTPDSADGRGSQLSPGFSRVGVKKLNNIYETRNRFDEIDARVQTAQPVTLDELKEGRGLAEILGLGAVERYDALIERARREQEQ